MAKVKDAVSVNLNEANIQNITIMDISPETAKKMLEKNDRNRSTKSLTVQKYARDMISGTWYDNGVPIVIDENGIIKDGQHRLHAIVKSGKTIRMLVLTVRSCEARGYDNNLLRSMSDRLKMGEFDDLIDKNNKYLTSTVAGSIATTALRIRNIRKPSPNESAEFIAKHADAVEYAARKRRTNCGISRIVIWVAIAAAYESGYSKNLLEDFCDAMITGIADDKRLYPVIKFRNWCADHRNKAVVEEKDLYMRAQYALKAVESCNCNATCKAATKEHYQFKW